MRPPCASCTARTCGLFGCLTSRQLARLEEGKTSHAYNSGQPVYYEGNAALAVYCILEGRIKLWRTTQNGDEFVLGTRSSGELMGYRAVLCGSDYAVTAEPLERSVVCAIPREAFVCLVRESPALALGLLSLLAVQSLTREDQLVARNLDPVRRRTARYLLELAPPGAEPSPSPLRLQVPLKRGEMAHLIGTTPETLSRTLHVFAARGIVELERHEIRVLDMERLQRIAR